jgi:hypothetical protein
VARLLLGMNEVDVIPRGVERARYAGLELAIRVISDLQCESGLVQQAIGDGSLDRKGASGDDGIGSARTGFIGEEAVIASDERRQGSETNWNSQSRSRPGRCPGAALGGTAGCSAARGLGRLLRGGRKFPCWPYASRHDLRTLRAQPASGGDLDRSPGVGAVGDLVRSRASRGCYGSAQPVVEATRS